MAQYQVKLFKDILSSNGRPFHCLQTVKDVEADAPENAVSRVLKNMHGTTRDWEVKVEALRSEEATARGKASPNPGRK